MLPRSRYLWVVLSVAFLTGCGRGDAIWVTGGLQKGGQIYQPPEGRKLALYFHPVKEDTSSDSSHEMEMANYNSKEGSFTVPGREGYGIRPGKYRIVVVETLRREERDRLNQAGKGNPKQKRIENDTNLLESTFGEKT